MTFLYPRIKNKSTQKAGAYCSAPSRFGTCQVTVYFSQEEKIVSIEIKGRCHSDSDNADIKEIISQKNETAQLEECHIISVELCLEYLEATYKGKKVCDILNTTTKKFDAVAERIYKEFKDLSLTKNLFAADKAGNRGQGHLMRQLRPRIKEGKQGFETSCYPFFEKDENDRSCIAFLQQDKDLTPFISAIEEEGTKNKGFLLRIDSWEALCFIYEHSLIDYRVLYQVPSSEQKIQLTQGLKLFDKTYGIACISPLREKSIAHQKIHEKLTSSLAPFYTAVPEQTPGKRKRDEQPNCLEKPGLTLS